MFFPLQEIIGKRLKLAKIKNFELKVVGTHGGEVKYDKLRASASRIFELTELGTGV